MKKSAVEWLVSELKKYDSAGLKDQSNYVIEMPTHILTELEEQAKEMEKQQGYSEEEVNSRLVKQELEILEVPMPIYKQETLEETCDRLFPIAALERNIAKEMEKEQKETLEETCDRLFPIAALERNIAKEMEKEQKETLEETCDNLLNSQVEDGVGIEVFRVWNTYHSLEKNKKIEMLESIINWSMEELEKIKLRIECTSNADMNIGIYKEVKQ